MLSHINIWIRISNPLCNCKETSKYSLTEIRFSKLLLIKYWPKDFYIKARIHTYWNEWHMSYSQNCARILDVAGCPGVAKNIFEHYQKVTQGLMKSRVSFLISISTRRLDICDSPCGFVFNRVLLRMDKCGVCRSGGDWGGWFISTFCCRCQNILLWLSPRVVLSTFNKKHRGRRLYGFKHSLTKEGMRRKP